CKILPLYRTCPTDVLRKAMELETNFSVGTIPSLGRRLLSNVKTGQSPPPEEGWLRHQKNFGEAYLSAADGVVNLMYVWKCVLKEPSKLDHPVRSIKGGFAAFALCRVHPSSRGGDYSPSSNWLSLPVYDLRCRRPSGATCVRV